jgi:Ras-related protein Rab-1A
MASAKPELKFKILIIGDSAVGKTSLLLKYVDNFFPETHMATIGVEYKTKNIETSKYKVILHLWDTAGQERFKSITKSFFNNANGIVFVYDITSKESFDGVKNWIKDAEPYGKFESILCGNKIDLEKKREVKIDSLKEYGLKKKIDVFETSAKTGVKVNDAFEKLVDLIIKSKSHDELVRDFGVKQGSSNLNLTKSNKKKNQNGGNCCNK